MTAPKSASVAKPVAKAAAATKAPAAPKTATRALRPLLGTTEAGTTITRGEVKVTTRATAGALRIDHSNCSHAKTKSARAACRSKVEAALKPATDAK